MTRKNKLILFASAAVVGAFSIAGYNNFAPNAHASEEEQQQEAAPQAPQAMPVDVATIKPENVQIWQNYSGHIVAVNQTDIRPQVSGIITDVKFEDGERVEKGDVLIIIDPRPYEAALAQAEALLREARTKADLAEKEYKRAKKLIDTDAISQSLLDERINNRSAAGANVKAAEAAVTSAQINLDYAHIKAPISGKVSRAELTVGNLVQAGPTAPLLTSIVADDQVYIDFDVAERSYIEIARKNNAETMKNIPVHINLIGTDAEYKGKLHSFDNRIDRNTGTVRARAIFDNKDGIFLPGMSVKVMLGSGGAEDKILLTERAIGTDQDRKFVYVVGDGGVTQYREIRIGESISGKRVILSGLKTGETVVTSGTAKIRPGMPVAPRTESAAVQHTPQ